MLSMLVSILIIASIAMVSATPAVCGDTNCQGSETCNNCQQDCGVCPPVCRNGILETGEECDDGNNNNNDGCSNQCKIEINSQGNTGSIWTTTDQCGADQQDVNQYAIGSAIYINAANLAPNTNYTWNITGNPGDSSCDPNLVVASGSSVTDSLGGNCFDTGYVVQADDCGIYKVAYNGKSDNYRVDPNLPPVPEFSTTVGILTALGAVGTFFLVRRK